MDVESGEAPFLTNIGLLMTYRCQVACPHCVIGAGPARKEAMQLAEMRSWIEQAAAYRDGLIKAVCFTGGEPFYDVNTLASAIAMATSCGMLPTVVTNAFWAETPERAIEVLQELRDLRVISVSADAYHQAAIPFERVRNALLAAKELGLFCDVAVCTEDEDDPEYRRVVARLEEIVDESAIKTVITFPGGRAGALHHGMTSECPQTACDGASAPTIFPDGRVVGCIGPVIGLRNDHPLLLGNLREASLAEILDAAEVNPVLHLLRVWGPGRLFALLERMGHGGRLPSQFVRNGMCNLCYSLMADEVLCGAMRALAEDAELTEKTAYARLFYFDENRMLEALGIASDA